MIRAFKSADHPQADGRQAKAGERQWVFSIPLEGGDDYLEVKLGKKAREAFIRMLFSEHEEDALEAGDVGFFLGDGI